LVPIYYGRRKLKGRRASMRRMHEWQNAVLFMMINAINIIPVNTP
jgi:hypothetical protein